MTFWQIIWFIIVSFAFIAYLIILFNIFADLFRDRGMSGWLKAIWIILLILFPFISAFVYVIARGPGMAERQAAALSDMKTRQDEYIKSVAATTTPADQIAQAKGLLDSGAISQAEFDSLKAKALSQG
ncbi:MAG: SHOCT domain-containing protein [Dermatophilaceae bacterium]